MIMVSDLTARTAKRPRVSLGPVTFSLEPGRSYGLVGAPSDGVELLLAVLAGAERVRKGVVTIASAPPGPRRAVAYVP